MTTHHTSTDTLGDEIATLFFRIQVATYRLLTLLRSFDEQGGWHGGFRSCSHWLSWRTGCSMGPAREKVRVARAIVDLPLIRTAMAEGRLSYCKARALTRVATPENEEELLAFATHGTVAHVERLVRGWRRIERQEDGAEDRLRHETRYLSVHPGEDGMYEVRGRLDPEVGGMLMKALEVVSDELFRQNPDEGAQQRQADALGLILREGVETEAVLHVTEAGTTTDEGVHVSHETSERLTCDAIVVEVTEDGGGTVLDVGRRRRTVSRRMRRALTIRDGGCRFPGCGSRHCEAHHVKHWSRGGETRMENLVMLCRFHHRAVHQEGFGVELRADGEAVFRTPDGRVIPAVGDAPDAVDRGPWTGARAKTTASPQPQSFAGSTPIDPWTGSPTWRGERVDIGWALEWFLRPREERAGGRVLR